MIVLFLINELKDENVIIFIFIFVFFYRVSKNTFSSTCSRVSDFHRHALRKC